MADIHIRNVGGSMKRTILTALIAATLGAAAVHYVDSVIVASILKSDDLSLTRNAMQADALLSIYEHHETVDQIQRDGDGKEVDPEFTPVEKLIVWSDQTATDIWQARQVHHALGGKP